MTTRSTSKAKKLAQEHVTAREPEEEIQWMTIMIDDWIAKLQQDTTSIPSTPRMTFITKYEHEYRYQAHESLGGKAIRDYVKKNPEIGISHWKGTFFFPAAQFQQYILMVDSSESDQQPASSQESNLSQQSQDTTPPTKNPPAPKQRTDRHKTQTQSAPTTEKLGTAQWNQVAPRNKKRAKQHTSPPHVDTPRGNKRSTSYAEAAAETNLSTATASNSETRPHMLLDRFNRETTELLARFNNGTDNLEEISDPEETIQVTTVLEDAKSDDESHTASQKQVDAEQVDADAKPSVAYDSDTTVDTTDSWRSTKTRFNRHYKSMEATMQQKAMEKTVEMVIDTDKFMQVCESAKANITRDTMKAVQTQMESYLKKEFATMKDETFVKDHRRQMEETWKDMKGEILERLWLLKEDTAKEKAMLQQHNAKEKAQLIRHRDELERKLADATAQAQKQFKDHVSSTYLR